MDTHALWTWTNAEFPHLWGWTPFPLALTSRVQRSLNHILCNVTRSIKPIVINVDAQWRFPPALPTIPSCFQVLTHFSCTFLHSFYLQENKNYHNLSHFFYSQNIKKKKNVLPLHSLLMAFALSLPCKGPSYRSSYRVCHAFACPTTCVGEIFSMDWTLRPRVISSVTVITFIRAVLLVGKQTPRARNTCAWNLPYQIVGSSRSSLFIFYLIRTLVSSEFILINILVDIVVIFYRRLQ